MFLSEGNMNLRKKKRMLPGKESCVKKLPSFFKEIEMSYHTEGIGLVTNIRDWGSDEY